jgi:hypothetical protein
LSQTARGDLSGEDVTMPRANQKITAADLTIDGVSSADPDGQIPADILIKGTTGRIPRWVNFPAPPAPGQPADYTNLYVYWKQNGVETEIFRATYTHVDDRPEFTFPITAQQMSVDGVAYIYYVLEGDSGNEDPSAERKLTIDHAVLPTLAEPQFPDATIHGYLNCTSDKPVFEGVRIKIQPDSVFAALDECVLTWQGFDSLNGSGAALTPEHEFRQVISQDDADNGFIVFIPFNPYVRPMFDNDSAIAQYKLYRGGVAIGSSDKGLVKIDRIVSGGTPCGGPP